MASTSACDRHLISKEISIETDHKSLIPLAGSRPLDDLPPRIVRFCLRLMCLIFNIILVPGKQMYVADALSRAPVEPAISDTDLLDEADAFMHATVACLPATPQRLTDITLAQTDDETCRQIIQYATEGWPATATLRGPIRDYAPHRASFTVTTDAYCYSTPVLSSLNSSGPTSSADYMKDTKASPNADASPLTLSGGPTFRLTFPTLSALVLSVPNPASSQSNHSSRRHCQTCHGPALPPTSSTSPARMTCWW